ncbi:MAG TPA: 23S rRNA (adenine(2030)-N(6))-methyltransferase RlmJ [Hyphomicrobiaceae bacterium]|nr:23S rRNA (adenine(2030)-N(6))-methyltransferase RlmJ [Hyphomicrobiaceae bacterium]
MNYRHAYHAGNFADVLKHTVLALVIEYLKRKPAPFRIVDTHAGSGLYALDATEAVKTREWEAGVGRLLGPQASPLPEPVATVMAPYLEALRAENDGGALRLYPGSPLIARRLMRTCDTLALNELHPEEHARLKAAIGRDRQVKVLALDGWLALKAQLPPKERRGIVLIDPPFEEERELERLGEGLAEGMRRFATGVFLAWYPIKDPKPIAKLFRATAAAVGAGAADKTLRVELMLRRPVDRDRLNGCGLIVVNPPHSLRHELAAILPELTRRLGDGHDAHYVLDSVVSRPQRSDRPAAHISDTPHRRKHSSA